jgi:4-hydroxy-tetrahydrodipicolinate synthase
MAYLYSLIEEFRDSPEFSVIVGAEIFIPETIINGGHGAVAGGANIFPRLFVELYEASVDRDMQKVAELREKVVTIGKKVYDVTRHASRHIKNTKSALFALGLCNNYVAHPFRKSTEEETKHIKQNLILNFNDYIVK